MKNEINPNVPVGAPAYFFEFLTESGKTFRIVTDKPLFPDSVYAASVRFFDAAELPAAFVNTISWGKTNG